MKKAIIIVNLGTAESLGYKGTKDFLNEFLMDKYVIQIPYIMRYILVKWIIVPNRYKMVAEDFKKSWHYPTNQSMITWHTENIVAKLKNAPEMSDLHIDFAMRYGKKHTIKNKIDQAIKAGVQHISFFPLYPQFADATVQTVIDDIKRHICKTDLSYNIADIFFNNENYINAIVKSINNKCNIDKLDKLVFSYHSLPLSQVKMHCPDCKITKCNNTKINIDDFNIQKYQKCYYHQSCYITEAVGSKLKMQKNKKHNIENKNDIDKNDIDINTNLKRDTNSSISNSNIENASTQNISNEDMFITSFQSKLGKNVWIGPSSAEVIAQMGRMGYKIGIISPSFITDCIETIVEIKEELHEDYINNGGKEDGMQYIDCLNDSDNLIQFIIEHHQSNIDK